MTAIQHFPCHICAAGGSPPRRVPPMTRVLFVGNSYTSRHRLPWLLADIAAAAHPPRPMHVDTITAGGASLRRHWNAGAVQRALAASRWDRVVLQEQSTLPLMNRERYHENVRLFAAEIAKHRARAALYLTWARRAAPQTQEALTRAVREIAAETGADVVPVGPAWHAALREDPGLALYADDGSHPTAAGSYLAACVFYVTLFDDPPPGEAVAEALQLDPRTAARLRGVAWAFRARNGFTSPAQVPGTSSDAAASLPSASRSAASR
jgi:hypothetical protein